MKKRGREIECMIERGSKMNPLALDSTPDLVGLRNLEPDRAGIGHNLFTLFKKKKRERYQGPLFLEFKYKMKFGVQLI